MPSLICRGGASPRLCSVSTPPFSPVVFPPASTWSVLSLHAATAVLRMGWRGGGGGGGRTSCTELKPPPINGIARPRPFVCCCVHRPTAVPPHPRSPSQPRRAVGAGSGDANDANGQSCDGAPRSGGNGPPWSYGRRHGGAAAASAAAAVSSPPFHNSLRRDALRRAAFQSSPEPTIALPIKVM